MLDKKDIQILKSLLSGEQTIYSVAKKLTKKPLDNKYKSYKLFAIKTTTLRNKFKKLAKARIIKPRKFKDKTFYSINNSKVFIDKGILLFGKKDYRGTFLLIKSEKKIGHIQRI